MRRLITFICALVFLPTAMCLAKDINFEATVNRTRVAVGQSIQLNLTFNNTQNIPALELPDMEGFTARYVGPSTSMSVVNGVVSSSITHIYVLEAVKVGKFSLGPLRFDHNGDRYTSNQISLEVLATAAPQPSNAQQQEPQDLSRDISDRVFVVLEAGKRNMYVNEAVPVTVKLYVNRLSVRDIQFPQIEHEGFSLGQFGQPKQYRDVVAGVAYDVIEFSTTIFGLRPGETKIGPANLKCNLIVRKQSSRRPSSLFDDDFFDSDVFDNFFGRYETHPLTLNSRSFPVTVLPLPEQGRPASFTGALGTFTFEVTASPSEVKVGDPVTLKAVVKGSGNLSTVTIPKVESTKDLKTYEPQIKQEDGVKTFEQVVMPMHADVKEIPAISFSFFNTETGGYETITRGPFAITVARPDIQEQSRIIESPQAPQASVPQDEKFGRDIIFIKESDSGWNKRGDLLYRNRGFWILQGLALVLYLCILVIHAWSQRLRSDVRFARKLQAPGKARRGMDTAKKLLRANKPEEFYDVIFDTLQEYLGDRFHLASKSITAGIIDEILKPRNVSPDIQEKISGLFRDCDMARYAPSGFDTGRMARALDDLRDVIDHLQRNKA